MNKVMTSGRLTLGLFSLLVYSVPLSAFQLSYDDWRLRADTDVGLGTVLRMEDPDPDLIGISNGGNAYSVNNDDGTQNFEKGDLGIAALRLDSRISLDYKELSLVTRLYGRYDSVYHDRDNPLQDGRPALPEQTRDELGLDGDVEELYLTYNLDVNPQLLTISLGKQVLNWGEVLTIPGGINFDAFDVARLRIPGASISEAKRANGLLRLGLDFTENVTFDLFYQYDWVATLPDPNGSYFATNDFAVGGGDFVMLGFGIPKEGASGLTVKRAADRNPQENGQYGINIKWYLEALNDAQLGFVAANYHSRIPYASGFALLSTPDTAGYFIEYPEDIQLFGLTLVGTVGDWSVGAEYAYRPNLPLQLEETELLYEALNFPNQIDGFVGTGNYIQGWRRHKVSQASVSLLRSWGASSNWFKADSVFLLLEIAANRVHDLPDQSVLRYNAPATYRKGPSDVPGQSPGLQESGWATDFSWGYRAVLSTEYNNAVGNWAFKPRLLWFHDVNGTTPGNGGAFVEDTKQLGLYANFQSPGDLSVVVGYNAYFGGGDTNLLNDRDHLSLAVEYGF